MTDMKNLTYFLLTLCLLGSQLPGLHAQFLCNPDTQPPTITCHNSFTVALNPETMSIEMASMNFVESVSDLCTDSVRLRIGTNLNTPVPPADSTMLFTAPGVYTLRIWAGDDSDNWSSCFTTLLITGPNSQFKHFEGVLYAETDGNCQQDVGEQGLANLPVEAVATTPSGIWETQGVTDANGHYSFEMSDVLTASATSIEVRIGSLANNGGGCQTYITVPAGYFDTEDTFEHDFAVNLTPGCHQLEVDLATQLLRRCFNSVYYVNYCNYGAETAENARIEIELDPFLTLVSSSVPSVLVSGNTYAFDLGDVAPGTCNNFSVTVLVSCDAVLGQTHCSTARIFPEPNCDPAFNDAELTVSGACEDGQVKFTITNTGNADMTEPLDYYVVEDVIMFMTGPLQLPIGESAQVSIPANGSTYRLELPQVQGHPFSVLPSATVEGCGVNPEGAVSLGFVTQFPQDDAASQIDIDCRENIGSYDPNDKQVFPRGATENNILRANTDLEYLIRFQNTGTDTAFTVVILDPLSANLDPATIRPGAASHPYTFTLLEDNVLKFSFNNILLPDSNVNLAGSQGFVKFRVKQLPDLADGTEILNNAAIYFDFNEPVLTNTVHQVIGTPFLTVGADNPVAGSGYRTRILPNPLHTTGLIQVDGLEGEAAQFNLYHPNGVLARQLPLLNGTAVLDAALSPAGLYYYTVTVNGRRVSSGKVVMGIK